MPDKVLESFSEVLFALLPESDFGRVVWLIVLCLFALMLTGRLKLEWIGKGLMYLWRRLIKCPLGKHSWKLASVGRLSESGGVDGIYKCKYCHKLDYFTGTIG